MDCRQIDVFRIPMRGPADISSLVALIESGELEPRTIVAIFGKAEGNGGVNDFTREYATRFRQRSRRTRRNEQFT